MTSRAHEKKATVLDNSESVRSPVADFNRVESVEIDEQTTCVDETSKGDLPEVNFYEFKNPKSSS